jgi:hypothetical protein
MTTFDDREKAFENKFKRDQELQFKVKARRNKLLGMWAASKVGVTGEAAEKYAKEVVSADFEKPGDDDVVQKVVKDLGAKGAKVSEAEVKGEMQRLEVEAKRQLMESA